jgi:hypothetical protein
MTNEITVIADDASPFIHLIKKYRPSGNLTSLQLTPEEAELVRVALNERAAVTT